MLNKVKKTKSGRERKSQGLKIPIHVKNKMFYKMTTTKNKKTTKRRLTKTLKWKRKRKKRNRTAKK